MPEMESPSPATVVPRSSPVPISNGTTNGHEDNSRKNSGAKPLPTSPVWERIRLSVRSKQYKNMKRICNNCGSCSDVSRIDPSSVPKILRKNDSIEVLTHHSSSDLAESRVLVLYTGGTIGMARNIRGALEPRPNQLESMLRRHPQLHDPEYCDTNFQPFCCEKNVPLVMPDTREKRRVVYTVFEYEPLLDSSNMTMDDWIRVAQDIKESYELFEGFVILHGTDTLAYTASALSFMLENLGKSVVITGSQIPIFETRSDGRDNFVGALIMAGNYIIPEVSVFFNNKLFRGNRTQKVSTGQLDAFGSPNLSPIATVGISIQVDYQAIFRPTKIAKFQVHSTLSRNVGLLRLFPSISTQTIEVFLQSPMEGVILQSYGAGNIPTNRKDLIESIKAATDKGIIIVNITQCANGGVESIYETGQVLLDAGVIPGMDMTPEAALTKLSYVLSKEEWDVPTKRKMMQRNIRGELTGHKHIEIGDMALIKTLAKTLTLTSTEETEKLKEAMFPCLLCGAANTGDISRIESLRGYGADLSAPDYDGRTAIHIACSKGDAEMAKYLLKNGSSVHARDKFDNTPLLCAVEECNADCIELLVECGAHLTLRLPKLGERLCSCAMSGNIDKLQCYHMAGADLSVQDPSGRTALHVAAEQGNQDLVRYLLLIKVSTNIKDMYGRTPKDIAEVLRKTEIVALLENRDI